MRVLETSENVYGASVIYEQNGRIYSVKGENVRDIIVAINKGIERGKVVGEAEDNVIEVEPRINIDGQFGQENLKEGD